MGWWQDLTGVTASQNATDAMKDAADLSIEEQRRQFAVNQANIQPYMDAGTQSLEQQQNLSGANGPEAQQAAYDAIQNSAAFQNKLATGERSILQSGAATGGVRGGDIQGVLARYSPELLASSIDQQYGQLSGLSSMGANAAAGINAQGTEMANNISDAYTNIGNAQAQQQMANYSLPKNFLGDLAGFGLNVASLF